MGENNRTPYTQSCPEMIEVPPDMKELTGSLTAATDTRSTGSLCSSPHSRIFLETGNKEKWEFVSKTREVSPTLDRFEGRKNIYYEHRFSVFLATQESFSIKKPENLIMGVCSKNPGVFTNPPEK